MDNPNHGVKPPRLPLLNFLTGAAPPPSPRFWKILKKKKKEYGKKEGKKKVREREREKRDREGGGGGEREGWEAKIWVNRGRIGGNLLSVRVKPRSSFIHVCVCVCVRIHVCVSTCVYVSVSVNIEHVTCCYYIIIDNEELPIHGRWYQTRNRVN